MSNIGGIPTLGEIAKLTGYSIATVSLVLRDKPGFSTTTITAIKDAAAALGYEPNRFATALRPENSRIIGYLLPNNISDAEMERWAVYDLKLMTAFTKEAHRAGYTVVAIPAGEYTKGQFANLRAVYAPDHVNDVELERSMGHSNIPLIAHNYQSSYTKVIDIYFKFRDAGLEAVRRLFATGAKKVGILIEPHIADYVANSDVYEKIIASLPNDVVVYGREYRSFDASEVIDQMIADDVDAVYSNLEVGKELIAEIAVSTKPEVQQIRVIPTIDLTYSSVMEMWLRDPHVHSIATVNSTAIFKDLFSKLDEFLNSTEAVVSLPVDVVVHQPGESVTALR